MNQKEKLIEIMTECPVINISSYESICELIDHLIANGVVVLPCKVGDTVYQVDLARVYESKITKMIYETDGVGFDSRAIGKHVFLTREEAERALEERRW